MTADAGRLPDVAAVPRGGLRAAAAGVLLRGIGRRMPVRIAYPDGRVTGSQGPTLILRRSRDVYARLGDAGAMGFGEDLVPEEDVATGDAYQAGDWDSDDLPGLLTVLATGLAEIFPPVQRALWRLRGARPPRAEANTPAGARRNVERHYDLSNDLFALFLDPSMTYSSALFDDLHEDLTAAQHRKIDRLLDVTGVDDGTRLLEIGTGWGELAVRAARRGARVVSVTLSEQQRELAVRRIAAAGMAGRAEVRRCDYRAIEPVPGGFDAVISVEMIEAVGHEYWPAFAEAVIAHRAAGGR